MRLIDGDELYREYQSVVCYDIACAECKAVDKDTGECRVDYLISDAPTIDAVSVVRCKECKYRDKMMPFCLLFKTVTEDNGYCYKAESEDE